MSMIKHYYVNVYLTGGGWIHSCKHVLKSTLPWTKSGKQNA